MCNIAQQLEALRQRIALDNDPEMPTDYLQRVAITQTGKTFNVDFYGDCFGEGYSDLLTTLAMPDVARHIRSIVFRGPDEGSNGTQNWDIEPLLATEATFPKLEAFSVQCNQPGNHNRKIIASMFEEDGVLARLLEKSPRLQDLTVPSAPNAAFFNVGKRPIRFLSVDAGYDPQNFISNLAASTCFPKLQSVEWGEYNETYMDNYLEKCTPVDQYRELFRSRAFKLVTRFVWRNPVCTEDDIQKLKALRPKLQLLIVRFSHNYV